MKISIEEQLRQYADAYEELQDASNAHAAIDRSSENFDEIVASRIQLDGKRRSARAARKNVVSRYEPPAPDIVHGRGSYFATKFTIGAAVLGIVLLFGTMIGAFFYLKAAARPHLSMDFGEQITLTTERPCTMTVPIEITNSSEIGYTVIWISRRLNAQDITVEVPDAEVAPNSTETFDVSFAVESRGGCPTVETVESQTISVHYRATDVRGQAQNASISKTT